MNLFEELQWRGLISSSTPNIESVLDKQKITAYIGFDPTSDSLHIGSLVPIILLKHLKNYGHNPIVLVGGATGMIGDPSGKSKERNILDEETLSKNTEEIKQQLIKILEIKDNKDFLVLNNYTWTNGISIIDFCRDIGKYLTVNYMMAKESVKKRISVSDQSEGMSFTEFTYQLFQAYDFLHLFHSYNCKLQLGGQDQWGNITSGIELIRKKEGVEVHGITSPLVTKSDGTKFGKTETGNIWLDKAKTSPYKFYQFWLGVSDIDAQSYIKYFTFLDRELIENLIKEHAQAPQKRVLQNKLAQEVTLFVHGQEALDKVKKSSQILFGKATQEELKQLSSEEFLEIFEGVPQKKMIMNDLKEQGLSIIEALEGFIASKAEIRRGLIENGFSVNKTKISQEFKITKHHLIGERYVLLQRGKKSFFILNFV